MTLGQGNLLNNRYRIVEILGRGGMGAVYRAVDESLGVEVAVKENLFTTEDYARQFRMEAVILAGIRHPNLPRVSDHFVLDDFGQYLVMDYIAGDDLRQCMEKTGPISEAEAVRIGAAACEALAYLHTRKPPILHRDIKLGNLKLTEDGQVYLVDFGLAKMAWEHEETMTGARAMTPGYSPPEQYGSARTDARSDVYSLGATLYAALTGVIPEDSLMRAVDGLALTPLREHRPEISARLAAVITTAMEVAPAQRYQTADEFRRALLGLSEPEVAASDEASAPAQSAPVVSPKRTGFWLRASLLFLLVAVIVVAIALNPLNRSLLETFLGSAATQPTAPLSLVVTATQPAPVLPSPTLVSLPTATLASVPTATLSPATPTEIVATDLPATALPNATPLEISYAALTDNWAQIFISNVDGTNLRQLTTDMNGACSFDWSPDGRQLVYTSPCSEKSSQYPLGSLYLLDLDNPSAKQLPKSQAGDFDPAWSPDGNQIAFTSLRDGSWQIYVYDFAADSLSRLTDPANNIQSRSPAWSSDGTKIVYTVRRLGLLQVWAMNADGSGKTQLLRSGGSFSDYLPVWAPDGEAVFFSETNADLSAPASLMKLTLADGQVKIVPIPLPVVDVDFSSDGLWLAYEYSDTKNQSIYLYRFPNGPPQRLTEPGRIYFDPVWRPVLP